MSVSVSVSVGVWVYILLSITSMLYGPGPIADTALTCTPYEAKGTRLLRIVTISVVALTGPCQE